LLCGGTLKSLRETLGVVVECRVLFSGLGGWFVVGFIVLGFRKGGETYLSLREILGLFLGIRIWDVEGWVRV